MNGRAGQSDGLREVDPRKPRLEPHAAGRPASLAAAVCRAPIRRASLESRPSQHKLVCIVSGRAVSSAAACAVVRRVNCQVARTGVGGSPSAGCPLGRIDGRTVRAATPHPYRILSQSKTTHVEPFPDPHFRQPQRAPAAPARQVGARRSTRWSREFEALSDAELRAKTDEFRQRVADGETLDGLLPEAFAVGARGRASACSACATSTCS